MLGLALAALLAAPVEVAGLERLEAEQGGGCAASGWAWSPTPRR